MKDGKMVEKVKRAGETIYDRWRVKIRMRDKLYGGVPKNPEVITAWLKERKKKAIKEGHDITPEISSEELKEIEEQVDISEESTWNTFKTKYANKEVGPYLDCYNVKAMLREAAFSLGYTSMKKNRRGFRQHYQHSVHIKPDILLIGQIVDSDEIIGHVTGPAGKASIIRRVDYTRNSVMEFEIWSVANGMLTEEMVINMLAKGQEIGLGANRTREVGKFDVIEMERLK